MTFDFSKYANSMQKHMDTLEEIHQDTLDADKKGARAGSQTLGEGYHEDVEIVDVVVGDPDKFSPGFFQFKIEIEKEGKTKKIFAKLPTVSIYAPKKDGTLSAHNVEAIMKLFRAVLSPLTTYSGCLLISKMMVDSPELANHLLVGRKLNVNVGYGKFGSGFHAALMDDPAGSDKRVVGIGAKRWDQQSKTEYMDWLKDDFGNPHVFASFEAAQAHGKSVKYFEQYSNVYRMSQSSANEIPEGAMGLIDGLKIPNKVVDVNAPVEENDVPFSQPVVEEPPTSAGVLEVEESGEVDSNDEDTLDIFAEDF